LGRVIRKAEIGLEFQDYIPAPPENPAVMYNRACSNDTITIESWRDKWIANVKANHEWLAAEGRGGFCANGIGQLFGLFRNRPVIVAGSGPSLKFNAGQLKDRPEAMGLVSCLHNFHFLEDAGAKVDAYVSLDAGEVTIEEVSEGGSRSAEEYWEATRERTLLAFIGSHPELVRRWRGRVLFFNAPVPDAVYTTTVDEIEVFSQYVSNGGNVLGACTYISRVFLGAMPIIFVGADFSFGYETSDKTGNNKFHPWDSKYDKDMGYCVQATDVFGIRVKTWQSYLNFKTWFDYIAGRVPGFWINCTEGGIMGAYPHGNIAAIRQHTLAEVYEMYAVPELMRNQAEKPHERDKRVVF
jgi:hypothetical protein